MDTWWKINKQQLRQRAKQTLAALSPETKKQQSQVICSRLGKYIDQYNTRAVYIPFSYEPDISDFVQQLRDNKKTVLLPQIHNGIMQLALYKPNSVIVSWSYGEATIVDAKWYDWTVDVCLVPGLTFDKQWQRLGHGKWYYDKFLVTKKCYTVGISYIETLLENIPTDTRDQRMDMVL